MAETKKKKIKKKNIRMTFSWTRLLIFLIIATMIACTYFVKEPIEKFVADTFNVSIKNTEFGKVISAGDLEVHYIDVGQGDSIAIRFPDDQTMLIDAGDSKAKKQLLNYLNSAFFKNDLTREFDYVLLTHSDSDHSGSMVAIYEEYQVNCSIRPYEYSTKSAHELAGNPHNARVKGTATYGKYIDAVYEENDIADDADVLYAHKGLKIESKVASIVYNFEFLTPNLTYYDDANDYSPMILLEYKSLSFLFTGDAQSAQFGELQQLIENNVNNLKTRLSRVTVYKAAHHGSALHDSNNLTILKELNPEYVVIEVGKDNKYKHPHQQFLDWLAEANITKIYRTDQNGNVLMGVSTTNGGLNIVTDVEVADAPQVLYYSWEIIAGTTLFVVFILCFYDYRYKKRQLLKQLSSNKPVKVSVLTEENEAKAAKNKKKAKSTKSKSTSTANKSTSSKSNEKSNTKKKSN